MTTAEIFSIGDELLRGIVQDTNSHWLTQRITARGASVTRITTLADDPSTTGAAIREALAREPDLLVTQGGLGPTDDDLTREAVAEACGVPLVANEEAEQIVARRYAELHAQGAVADVDIHEARARMARLPRGARATDNQVGTAPGVILSHGPTTIVCLPGVPPELRWIWDNALGPLLDDVLGPGGFHERTVVVDLLDESKIAWLLSLTQERHPSVYVKSRASGFGSTDHVRVTMTASAGSQGEAAALVETAMEDLLAALAAEGVGLRD